MRSYAREVIGANKNLKDNIGFKKTAGTENVLNTDLAVLSGNKNYIDEQYIRDFADMWAKSAEKTGAWVFEKSSKTVEGFCWSDINMTWRVSVFFF